MGKDIEVAFSPELFPLFDNKDKIVVVIDILRATSVICTMFANGLEKLIPVKDLDEARALNEKGYLVAAERNGNRLDFADFGNSPFLFTPEAVDGKTLVYSTTNGTNAINIGKDAHEVIIASFLNISAVEKYLLKQDKDVLILCAGWKGKFCLEDSVCAGALSERLLNSGNYSTICDSVKASLDFWKLAKDDLMGYIQKVAQRERLRKLGLDDVIEYCHQLDQTEVIPYLNGKELLAK